MVSKNVVPWMGSNFTPYLPSYFGDTDNMLSLAGNRLTDVIFALTLLFFFRTDETTKLKHTYQ